jgi:hypothetical protein
MNHEVNGWMRPRFATGLARGRTLNRVCHGFATLCFRGVNDATAEPWHAICSRSGGSLAT